MDRKELEAKVLELIAITFEKDPAEISVDSSFKTDLAAPSVKMVALVSEIENQLDAAVMLTDASACETVADLVDLVEEEM